MAATQFTASASGGTTPYTYAWDFGDGTNTSGLTDSIDHVYEEAGNYSATVVVTDAAGVAVPATDRIDVVLPLLATLSVSATQVTAGQSVSFSAAASRGLGPYSYSWSNLPPGCSSQNLSVLPCVPTGAATTEVTVTVHDAVGESAAASKFLQVYGAIVASARASPATETTCNGPLTVNFTSAVEGGIGPYTYSWNFGDGSPTSPMADPVHTYNPPSETYQVGLTVKDADNATQFVAISANVSGAPCPGSTTVAAVGGIAWEVALGVGIVLAVLVALAVVLRNRNPRPTPGGEAEAARPNELPAEPEPLGTEGPEYPPGPE
jgi:PKD repeat protein